MEKEKINTPVCSNSCTNSLNGACSGVTQQSVELISGKIDGMRSSKVEPKMISTLTNTKIGDMYWAAVRNLNRAIKAEFNNK